MDSKAHSSQTIGSFYGVNGRKIHRHYKDWLSDFKEWDQKSHAKEWLIFPKNIGKHLSIDETSLSHGELYTILTNKSAKGKKGCIVAGTKAEDVITVIEKIPIKHRRKVTEITLDMASNMGVISKKCFPLAVRVTDRFHVQQLATEALQEIRVKHRWAEIDAENEAIEKAKTSKKRYDPLILSNGDTIKQLLARSRYVLYKRRTSWTENQQERARILFDRYPDIEKAYELAQKLSWIFEKTKEKILGYTRLAQWHEKVRQSGFK